MRPTAAHAGLWVPEAGHVGWACRVRGAIRAHQHVSRHQVPIGVARQRGVAIRVGKGDDLRLAIAVHLRCRAHRLPFNGKDRGLAVCRVAQLPVPQGSIRGRASGSNESGVRKGHLVVARGPSAAGECARLPGVPVPPQRVRCRPRRRGPAGANRDAAPVLSARATHFVLVNGKGLRAPRGFVGALPHHPHYVHIGRCGRGRRRSGT